MTESSGEYIARINQVQDYIEKHLDETLTVETLASLIHFSEYYFHRMYTVVAGESLYSFIKRIRLEKAAFLLQANRQMTITEIGLSVGFGNSSSFAKAFKGHFGISATSYRESKNGQAGDAERTYNEGMEFEAYFREVSAFAPISLQICHMKAQHLVYTRYTGPYKGDAVLFQKLFTKLYEWVGDKGLLSDDAMWYTLYHDLGSVTEEDYLRLSVCMSVPEPATTDGDIGNYLLDGGLYVVARFEVTTEEYQKAWDHMFMCWLEDSGYYHDDRIPYESYPRIAPSREGTRVVDICIPIAPLK